MVSKLFSKFRNSLPGQYNEVQVGQPATLSSRNEML
jgi:hypothetical protein